MDTFQEIFEKRRVQVEQIIYAFMPKEEGYQKNVIEAMNYSLTAGGKRLRPMLMLETARLFGGDEKEVYPFMAALEMIHTYSLVHDDLPAMDNDSYRRGKLTTHKKYGHAMGILAGDGLLNYAYEVCAKGIIESKNKEQAVKALACLSDKAGVYGMVGGQTVDVEHTGKPMDEKVLQFVYELKTSALIQTAMMCGAILAGAGDEKVEKLGQIGLYVGLAFQVQDDILDLTSTTEVLGKPVRSDEKNHKVTYVTLYGLEGAKQKVEEYSREAIRILDSFEEKNDFLRELLISLISREK